MNLGVDDAVLSFAWWNLPHRDRLIAQRGFPKTTWLFGAGASRHFGLNTSGVLMPLARDFFRAMQRLPTSDGLHARVGELTSYVWHTRRIHPSRFEEFDEDIEGFMTSVEEHLNRLRAQKDRGDSFTTDAAGVAMVATNMGYIFANVINEAQNGPTSPCYDELLRYCGPDDKFVTLNWDTLLDRSLAATGCWNPNTDYGIEFDAAFSGTWRRRVPSDAAVHRCGWKLLKLHGSTNWLTPHWGVNPGTLKGGFTVPGYKRVFLYWDGSLPYTTHAYRWRGGYQPTCYGYYPPNAPAKYFPDADLQPRKGRLFIRTQPLLFDVRSRGFAPGVPTSPLLITPVRQKRYDGYSRTIDEVWKAGAKAILDADRLVLIGYSFPETDGRIRQLVEDALLSTPKRKELLIVDLRPQSVAARLGDKLMGAARKAELFEGSLEQFLHHLAGEASTRMRAVMAADEEVRLWVERLASMRAAGVKLYA